MKKKLILMGACAAILIILFAGNVIRKIADPDKSQLILREGDMITVEESIQLLRFLGVDEAKMEETMKETMDQNLYLNFGQSIELLQMVSDTLGFATDSIINKLSFSLMEEPENKAVLTEEFLDMYEGILSQYQEGTAPVTETTFFVLGAPTSAAKDEVMITDKGEYTYEYAKGYESFYENGILNFKRDLLERENNPESKEENALEEQQDNSVQLSDYIDHPVTALISGEHIVYMKEILEEEATLHNVWITSGTGGTVSVFLHNIARDFSTKYDLSQEIEGKIADIVLQDGLITKISIKPDVIQGKVLLANKEVIEVEGYGRLAVDEHYKIYKIYNELSMEVTNSILVGYEATDFVVADGKVVAALITEPIKAENIRVLIKTDNFAGLYHEKVMITADREFIVTIGKKETTYDPGTELTLTMDENWEARDRVQVRTNSEEGKIKLLSVKRSGGNPAYRGTIEVAATEQGFIIINDLSLEEYLYGVIPSEMPTYYGLEALKVQAICARSYAYNQLFANSYGEYGAHVDDSVAYQVYNNIAENEDSILAVKDTYGKVIEYKDAVVTAYYFSTSSGHTASIDEVWKNTENSDYLIGKLQTVYKENEMNAVEAAALNQERLQADFSMEDTFRTFILNPEVITYDSEFPWYRWKVTITLEDVKKSIDKNLEQRYNANPASIQTLTDNNGKEVYESIPVNTIGTVKDIKALKREKSGIISELILVGSKHTIKVSSEYNIRVLLAPLYDDVIKQDESKASGLSMLPSAFFILDKNGQEITINGGGYGHGVGMSQNGVKAMTEAGIAYEDIIKHYYTGVDLGYIY
ncbi:MAG: putative rane protein [Anaerocolumna sp.]|jgi:stage II sporulation protein D|nr:putative rane protein [Anaerocolumna sp.]